MKKPRNAQELLNDLTLEIFNDKSIPLEKRLELLQEIDVLKTTYIEAVDQYH